MSTKIPQNLTWITTGYMWSGEKVWRDEDDFFSSFAMCHKKVHDKVIVRCVSKKNTRRIINSLCAKRKYTMNYYFAVC
jgi:hypothetical protein